MASGTVAYTDTTGNKDYLGIIAGQIGRRLKEASDMASDERDFAEKQAELGGTSLDEAGIGKGYFFKRALGSRFGGDKIARTRGRMGATGAGTSPTGNYKTRFRGGFDYNVTNEIQASTLPLSSALSAGLSGVEGGLVSISQSISALARGMDSLARSQEDAARQAILNGAFMQAFLNHMQREGARNRARSEEVGLEGGSRRFRGFGGGGSGRGMINVTPSGTGGGGGRGATSGGLGSFLSSQLLGKKTATINKIAQSSPKVAKALGYPSKGPRITGTPALPAAGQSTASALTKSSDQAAIKLAGNRTIQKAFGRLGVTGTPQLIKGARDIGKTSLAAVKTGGAALLEKSLTTANKIKKFVTGPDYLTTSLKGLPVDFFLDDPTDIMMANMGKNVDAIDSFASARAGMVGKGQSEVMDAIIKNLDVESADDAVKLYSKLRSGTAKDLGYRVFSEAEADKVLEGILGEDNFKKWAGTAKKPYKAAAKKTIAQKMLGKTDDVAKIGAKGATKLGAKALGRSILKKLPVIAGLAGIYFGIERALKGDLLGAGLEITSGLLGATGVGGSAGLVIDGYLLGRDMGMMPMARGGFLTKPTPVVAGEAGAEGFFPLEGARGKKTFQMFGDGILKSQLDNKGDVSALYAMGNKKYFDDMGGWSKFLETFGEIFDKIAGAIGDILYNIFSNIPILKRFVKKRDTDGGDNNGNPIMGGVPGAGGNLDVGAGGGRLQGLSEEDFKWLAYGISGEAGGGDDMYAVAASILNRYAGGGYGSIEDVIKAPGQYHAYEIGTLRHMPDVAAHFQSGEGQEKIVAALELLKGRGSFKGQSALGNRVASEDPMVDPSGNYYHYGWQGAGKNAQMPAGWSPPTAYEKFIMKSNTSSSNLKGGQSSNTNLLNLFSTASNPNDAASILNGQSGMFSMGSQFMMPTTIVNNYNTVAGGSGSGNDDSFSTGFPSFAQGFIVPYSMDALK